MLGNSIYSDIPKEEAERLFPDHTVIGCSSYGGPVTVTRTE
jgi:hypothetical protein